MQRLDLQFYAFFVSVLCGVLLGFLFDLLRILRNHFRPGRVAEAGADLLFWLLVTAALTAGLFLGNWGEPRFYVMVALLLGLWLYFWLGSPVVTALVRLAIRLVAWSVGLVAGLLNRLIWAPLLFLGRLLWMATRVLWRWMGGIGRRMWLLLLQTVLRPLVGPYRWGKLRYLLLRRRLRRWLGLHRGRRPPRR